MGPDQSGTCKGCDKAAASPPCSPVRLGTSVCPSMAWCTRYARDQRSGRLQSRDSHPCQQAQPKNRIPGNQLCKKEGEALVFSSLLSTMILTAALWHKVALLPAP